MLAIFFAVYWNSQRDRQYHELSVQYHLASLKHIATFKEEIYLLRLRYINAGDHKNDSVMPGLQVHYDRSSIVNALALMTSETNTLVGLHQRYAEPQFSAGLTRLQDAMRVVRQRLTIDTLMPAEQEAAFEPLLVVLQQLERLHLITYEDRITAEAIHKQRGRLNTLVVLIIVVLSSSALIGLFLSKMRTAVTRQIQAEDELRALNSELDQRIEERTAELEDARKEAEQANRAKSEFLSRMSHELRTPMNAVLGFAQLLEHTEELLNPKQRKFVKQIINSGGHLLELINEVLDLARIESGKYDLRLGTVAVGPIVQECIDLLGPVIGSKHLQLENHIDSKDDCTVIADPKCLRQVLLNLMNNAAKYNRERGRITLHCGRNTHGRLRIGVSDTGQGIPAADQSRIFQPFERLNADTQVEGTGIGLAVSKQLVELMGGQLSVDSRPGEGSTFWIELNSDSAGRDNNMHTLPPGAAM
jgi:signal transduction histidine kinase